MLSNGQQQHSAGMAATAACRPGIALQPALTYPQQQQQQLISSVGGGGGGAVSALMHQHSQQYEQSSVSRMLRDQNHPDRDEALTRYRQKRKTRHFEKTIRYATRQVRRFVEGKGLRLPQSCNHGSSVGALRWKM